ncbi:M20/M25/M40 family metallo-hydrolase [Streptomyces sp. NPDC050523]|uniref:M20/M25/M40 family metallo-hydrolase n=1 Tax=Streptomyces sp. NPDC050523 TaxID=3365622 RepID=UPI0037A6B91E
MTGPALVAHMEASLPRMLHDLETLVTCESPSGDLDAVAASAAVVADVGAVLLDVEPEQIVIEGRTHLRWRLGDAPSRVLLLGHHDTVWPIGSLARHPFSVSGGLVRGPGCFDMKAGLVMALHAVAALPDPSGVTLLVTGDEELGSPTSRRLVEEEATGCAAALVLEASADGGALKTERKGVSLYEVGVYGRSAHAGLEPERGVNATVELAHHILTVGALTDPARGTSVTPTVLTSGHTSNTVPGAGRFAVDVRVRDTAEQVRVDTAMRDLRPVLRGARLEITGGPNRPPLQHSASAALFARAVALAGGLGLPELAGTAVGGASDGNLTAGVGTPTLDGLGAVGGGAHADDEHVVAAQLPARTALLAALTHDLLSGRPSAAPGRQAAEPALTAEGNRP